MAKSGTIYSAWKNSRRLQIDWTVTSQDQISNTSTIRIVMRCYCGVSTNWQDNAYRYRFNGETHTNSKSTTVLSGNYIPLITFTSTVNHAADGTGVFPVYLAYPYYNSSYTMVIDDNIVADTIPRESTISCDDFTVGTAGTITIIRANDSFTHTIKYAFGESEGTICTKTSATSVSWIPSLNLASEIPNDVTGSGTLICETYSGDTLIGTTTAAFTAAVPESVVPAITSFTASRLNNTVPSAWGIYVQGKSQCSLTTVAAGAYSSTIQSYSVKHGTSVIGTSASVTTAILTNSGTVSFTVTVTDSRGRTATRTLSINVVEYSSPAINSTSTLRCRSDGTEDDDGTYIKINCAFAFASCSGKNSVVSKVYFKKSTDSAWSSGIAINNASDLIIGSGTIDVDSSYDVKYELIDAFTTVVKTDVVSTSFTTIDFKAGGKGVAIGKASETDNLFECAMNAKFNGSTEFSGSVEFNGSVSGVMTDGVTSGTAVNSSNVDSGSCYFFRVGKIVVVNFYDFKVKSGLESGYNIILATGLPAAPRHNNYYQMGRIQGSSGTSLYLRLAVNPSGQLLLFYNGTASVVSLNGSFTYITSE